MLLQFTEQANDTYLLSGFFAASLGFIQTIRPNHPFILFWKISSLLSEIL